MAVRQRPRVGDPHEAVIPTAEAGAPRTTWAGKGEPVEPPPASPARGPPTDWAELVQIHDDRNVLQATDRRAARDRHPQPLSGVGHEASKPRERPTETRSAPTRARRHRRGMRGVLANRPRTAETPNLAAQGQSQGQSVSRKTVAEVPLNGLASHPRPTPSQNSCGTSHISTPENVPAGPIHEHFSDAGLNLLEVPGDHLPEPVGVSQRLRVDAIDRLLGLFDKGIQLGTRPNVQPPEPLEELPEIFHG